MHILEDPYHLKVSAHPCTCDGHRRVGQEEVGKRKRKRKSKRGKRERNREEEARAEEGCAMGFGWIRRSRRRRGAQLPGGGMCALG